MNFQGVIFRLFIKPNGQIDVLLFEGGDYLKDEIIKIHELLGFRVR